LLPESSRSNASCRLSMKIGVAAVGATGCGLAPHFDDLSSPPAGFLPILFFDVAPLIVPRGRI